MGVIVAICGTAAVVVIGLGFVWFGNATGSSEDPDLARKQWEVERARTPGGGAPPPTTAPGMTPGRDGELAAREQHPGGN